MKLSNSRLQFAKTEIEQCVKGTKAARCVHLATIDISKSSNLLMKSLDYKLFKNVYFMLIALIYFRVFQISRLCWI